MRFFAAILKMKDFEKVTNYRPKHIDFLQQNERAGNIFARGRFADNRGGLVIYMAMSLEEAVKIAESDPYITSGAATLELYEWNMKVASNQ